MKKQILAFVLGALIFSCIGAGVVNQFITVKPATPKHVFAVTCGSTDAVKYINKYTKQGFIVKAFYPAAQDYYPSVLVMEKY